MRKEFSKKLTKKNKFESVFKDAGSIEYFSDKNNCALFGYASDNKKRPMNLVLGSLFNSKVLDMFEYEVTNYLPISHFAKDVKIASCMKPVIIFQGDQFETDFQYERMRKFFLDFFRIHDVDEVNISDLRRLMVISVGEDKEIKMRSFQVEGPISEYTLSDLNLTEIGPSLNLKVRNVHLGSKEFFDLACRQPKELTAKKTKNIEHNALGEKRGRIHMAKQNLKTVALKRYKRILGKKKFDPKGKKEKALAAETSDAPDQ
jgi:ribosome production factor 2